MCGVRVVLRVPKWYNIAGRRFKGILPATYNHLLSCLILHGISTRNRWGACRASSLRGCAKEKIPKIRGYYGSGWVGPGLTRNFFVENRPKISLNQYWYFGVVYHVYSVCTYIAKSCWVLWFECSVHVSDGFPKKSLNGVSSIQVFLWIFGICLTHSIPSPQPTRATALPGCLPILASQKPAEIGSSPIIVFHLHLLCDFSILFTKTYYDCYHIYIKGKLTK